jgi:hypothetical protein
VLEVCTYNLKSDKNKEQNSYNNIFIKLHLYKKWFVTLGISVWLLYKKWFVTLGISIWLLYENWFVTLGISVWLLYEKWFVTLGISVWLFTSYTGVGGKFCRNKCQLPSRGNLKWTKSDPFLDSAVPPRSLSWHQLNVLNTNYIYMVFSKNIES